jgi:signal transduction histidine kinase
MVLLTGFTVLTYVSYRRSLQREFDQHLLHELRILLPLVEFTGDGPTLSRFEAMRGVAYQTDGVFGTYVRLLDRQGGVLYESPNLEGHSALPVVLPDSAVEYVVSRTWQDGAIRSHYHPLFNPLDEHAGWLEVSGYEWSVEQQMDQLLRTFTLGVVLSFVLALIGGYLLARRALKPVDAVTRVANEIRSTSLNRRIPTDGRVQDELTRLTETINALLERIEASFHRERRFSANAAHELVTPLSAVRGEIELALRSPDVPEPLVSRLEDALADIDRMNAIVRSLLQLSSVERLERTEFESVDAHAVVLDHLERFEDRSVLEERRITHDIADQCIVRTHREGLGKVIDNLLDNALKYTERSGTVHVELRSDDDEVVLAVTDDGIGFDAESTAQLFDRFYRASGAARHRAGSGLGLAIVQAIVLRLGGSVTARSDGQGRGARFEVRLPAA